MIEKYKKAIFQLDEMIRHMLIVSNDVKNSDYWFAQWEEIEGENQEVWDEVYKSID